MFWRSTAARLLFLLARLLCLLVFAGGSYLIWVILSANPCGKLAQAEWGELNQLTTEEWTRCDWDEQEQREVPAGTEIVSWTVTLQGLESGSGLVLQVSKESGLTYFTAPLLSSDPLEELETSSVSAQDIVEAVDRAAREKNRYLVITFKLYYGTDVAPEIWNSKLLTLFHPDTEDTYVFLGRVETSPIDRPGHYFKLGTMTVEAARANGLF